jgi:hypothetical protein
MIENTITENILTELKRAEVKFPFWPTDVIYAAAIVNEESGELIRAALQLKYENGNISELKKEAIQCAAMCIRFLKHIHTYK